MNQEDYRSIISGKDSSLRSAFLRICLASASVFYYFVITVRNFLYPKGLLRQHRVEALVISIGNITVGGTGKTPLVIWLCDNLLRRITEEKSQIKCAVLTRGYKAQEPGYADEPEIITKRCPQTKVIVNANRLAGAKEAIEKFGAKVLVMDDGFQHRRLARDIDIVVIDATCPFGYRKMLPAGLLREPVTALRRADIVVINHCERLGRAEANELEGRVRLISPHSAIARAGYVPVAVRFADDTQKACEELKQRKVFGFCGIGNPGSFFNSLADIGVNLTGTAVYDDHHHYTSEDIEDIRRQALHNGAELALSTEKDWTKIKQFVHIFKEVAFAYLVIELKFVAGEEKITGLIKNAMMVKISSSK
ncbi:MAG: tetraacyldisaccharide 4'-kinase [Sedimentisphaerales bacterium]|nr:tetraacyldisaccharide 4'-kinase [Sedimentisphaerales bacterium]